MDDSLLNQLKQLIRGDVLTDDKILTEFSHDASIFEVKPQIIIAPRDSGDLKNLVKFVSENKEKNPSLSLTARSGGTDMSGGPLNNSIILDFTKYFNHLEKVTREYAISEPGVFYRDFEKETLKHDAIFPSYPASREICTIGGIVANNSGGEKSLRYGKTENYVESLKVVLSDGNEYEFKALNEQELKRKMEQKDFEGKLYNSIYKLITNNYELITKAKPSVSKNSAGYFLWNVYDKEKGVFDLTKLFVGSQGTLGLITETGLGLIPTKKYSEMMVVFLKDLKNLGEIINRVLPFSPETFETYDDNTLKLAIRYSPELATKLGAKGALQAILKFTPEFLIILTRGIPKLILQIEFEADVQEEINTKMSSLKKELAAFDVKILSEPSKKTEEKYWLIRRESFNLLRQKVRDKHSAPFIDDFVVKPEFLSEFLPKLRTVLNKYPHLVYTIAGHLGNGNFHIIPLMKIEDPKERDIIPKLSDEVYNLVLEYKGSITGEHNDGLIRTPYLEKMYGKKIVELFEETKKIFDPLNIFNPGKKVGGDLNYSMSHIRTSW